MLRPDRLTVKAPMLRSADVLDKLDQSTAGRLGMNESHEVSLGAGARVLVDELELSSI